MLDHKEVAKHKLSILAYKLMDQRYVPTEIGLKEGKIGLVLFYFTYYKLYGDGKCFKYALDLLKQIFDQLDNGYDQKNIQEQYADFGSFLCFLRTKIEFRGSFDVQELLKPIDLIQDVNIRNSKKARDIDIFTGLLCSGNYFLWRIATRPESKYQLLSIIQTLEDICVKEGNTVYWVSTLLNEKIYLGITHGIGSVILFLSRCIDLGLLVETCQVLIEGGINYLFSMQYPAEVDQCFFPFYKGYNGRHYDPLELCYGDLGILVAIYRSSLKLNPVKKENYKGRIMPLINRYAEMTTRDRTNMDPSLLRGIAGSCMLFTYLYELDNRPSLKQAANLWSEELTKIWEPDILVDNFLYYKDHVNCVGKNVGYCYGDSGIGLVLMERINPKCSDYRKFILPPNVT